MSYVGGILLYIHKYMKKLVLITSLALSTLMVTSAQINVTGGSVQGTVNGVPVSVGVGGYAGGVAAGAGQVNGGPLLQLLALAQTIVVRLVPFLIGIAVITFFWFLIKYVIAGGEDADGRRKALAGMGYALIAIFVMVSLWGIIGFAGNLLGINQGGTAPAPGLPIPQ
jgi:hypothetical protein